MYSWCYLAAGAGGQEEAMYDSEAIYSHIQALRDLVAKQHVENEVAPWFYDCALTTLSELWDNWIEAAEEEAARAVR